jgi:hypothetical protein
MRTRCLSGYGFIRLVGEFLPVEPLDFPVLSPYYLPIGPAGSSFIGISSGTALYYPSSASTRSAAAVPRIVFLSFEKPDDYKAFRWC